MFPSIPILEAVSQPFKRSQLGLFHGKTKQYGNNVPFSKHKTRRTWLPNVQRKRLFSETLGEDLRVKVTTRALRTIKKHGGLDNYVLKTRAELLAWEGMRIRLMVRDRQKETAREAETLKAKKREEYFQTPEGQVEKNIEMEQKALLERRQATRRVLKKKPTLWDAKQARLRATEARGAERLVSGKRTIQYLQEQKREQERILRHRPATFLY